MGRYQGSWDTVVGDLTLEVESEIQGLSSSGVLTDDFLQVNLGDLDQVPCGQAALISTDLVDGACRDICSVSLFCQTPVPNKHCSATPLHILSLSGMSFPYPCPLMMNLAVPR